MEDVFDRKVKPVFDRFDKLQTSVDAIAKDNQDLIQEFTVLKHQYRRLREVLVEKGVVTEEELAVIDMS
jgi:hypothetical protein